MNSDRPSFTSRWKVRDITQPITKSAHEFVHGVNHQVSHILGQSGRCPERRFRGDQRAVLNSPSGLPSPAYDGMATHVIQIPSMTDAALCYPNYTQDAQSRQSAYQFPMDHYGPETHPDGFHFMENGWQQQQHSTQYINMEPESPPPFSPSYSSSSPSTPVFRQHIPVRAHQYHPNLSFVNPPTSSAVPPISEPFQTPLHPRFRPHYPFAPHTSVRPSGAFHSPESPGFPSICSPTHSDHFHSNFHPKIPQYQHQFALHSHSQSPSSSVPRSFLADQQQQNHQAFFELQPSPVFNLHSTKRPLNVSSNSSSGHSHRTLFSASSPKHQVPNRIECQGLFDHLQPFLYSADPFSLENSPELNNPHALVFPTAKQELDPDFRRFPKGPSDPNKDRMGNNKVNEKNSTASNHNLVGHRIDGGRLEFMSVLGLGAYGVVYLARDLNSPDMQHPRLYAVKALNKVGLDARQKSFQRREIALHSLASPHPSIVTLHAVIESPSCIFVILDYCPDGDLFGMITDKQRYLSKTDLIKQVFIQIVEAVQFCHRLGISHRDLKPENILCKKGGEDVVLADFGLATSERTSSDFGCGSTFYMSPECQGGLFQRLGSYSTLHNDIWSLGVILVNLTCGRNPWKQACPSDETFRAYLANPDFLRSILPVSDSCNKILKRIFALNPLARISLADLKTEIAKVDTFNMTTEELSKSTRATRDAARAWRKDVPASPKPAPQPPSSWKNTLTKKTKKSKNNEAHAQRHPIPADGSVWDQPVRYEESSSSSSATFYNNESNDSSLWNYPNSRPAPRQTDAQDKLRSPINGVGAAAKNLDDETPRIRFVSPPQTPRTPQRVHAQNAISGRVPTGPLVNAFTSTSISSSNSSSSSSGDWSKKPRNFTSRFGVRKHVNFVTPPTEPTGHTTKKKLLIKPMSFNRPNAPSPIVLKPSTPDSSASSSSSRSRGLVTPTVKKGKHTTLTFLPSTPPSSASPKSTTFGFSRNPKKFYAQELPLTPITPSHPRREDDKDCITGHPPRRRMNKNGAPITPPKKKHDPSKFSLFSSSDEEGFEGVGEKVDADFDPEEDDDEDESYRSSYPAYAEWAKTNESVITSAIKA